MNIRKLTIRKKFLNTIAYLTVLHTWWMAIGILLLTFFLGYHSSTLQMRTGFDHLLVAHNPRIAEYKRIIEEFQNESNIMLLARGEEDSLKAYAEGVKPLLENFNEWVASVHTKIPEDFYRRNALKLLSPDQLDNFGPMYYDPNLISFLKNLNNSFEKEYQRNDEALKSRRDELDAVVFLEGLKIFVDIQGEVMHGKSSDDIGQKAVDAIIFGEPYMFSPDKNMMLIMIEPTFNMLIEPDDLLRNINGIEKIVKDTSVKYGVTADITGSLVFVRDKNEAFTFGSWKIFILALIIIFILVVFSFKMWISPLLMTITVIAGVTWALGVSSFLVDYLNMMTAMMSIVLIGLGIDSSIHIISGYTEKRNQGLDVAISMRETLQRFGPGIMTGGITTGLAFLTLIISETEGMQEMGIILGVGIIITMLATIVILPTILVILERTLKTINRSLPTKDISYPFLGQTAQFIARYRLVIIIIFVLSTGFLLKRAGEITVDYNYLNMEPVNLKSIQLQDELIDAFNLSSNFVMFTTDNLDEARELTKRAREMATTGWVESISDYLPDSDGLEKQYRYLQDIRRKLKSREIRKQMSSHDMKMYRKEIERLEANIIELQDLAYLDGEDKVYDRAIKLVGEVFDSIPRGNLTQFINSIDTGFTNVELTFFQQEFSKAFKSTIMEMANTEPLTLWNLPMEIKNRFTGKSGNIFLINVYPKNNIWEDTRFLNHFTDEVTELSEKATGLPLIFVELMDIMSQDGRKAIYLVIFAVFLVLLLYFRSLKYTLIGMVPLVFGVIWMTGVMELSGLQFTMMNMLAVPLVIGIGINEGVHILHRWRMEKNLDIVYRSTGKAILLTSLITMLGFGSLWFTTYRGLGSMGIALFIGIVSCFLATLFVMPAILGLHNKS